jgi:hypothetical protein
MDFQGRIITNIESYLSLNIVREELNRCIGSINLHKIGTHEDKEDIVTTNAANILFGSSKK